MTMRILCVDDDPNILQGIRRQFRKTFSIETAGGGAEGLELIATKGPFAVVASDMRMPGMDGIQFLKAVREQAPDTTRIMLTGNADQQTAIDAVNEGQIFRFLTKPCPPESLAAALTDGVKQYQLMMAERELLEETLRGSVKVLTDVLALANPTAFGQASRVRRIVQGLGKQMNVDDTWQYEVAAMLSQIGCVTLPSDTLERWYRGERLSPEEAGMVDGHPTVGRDLVAKIPRLEDVAEIIGHQHTQFASGGSNGTETGTEIPLGARILSVALDFDVLAWRGLSEPDAIVALREQARKYDPEVFGALEELVGFEEACVPREVGLKDLTTQMILAEDVRTVDGTLLVGKGQEVTTSIRQRLLNFARNGRLKESARVLVRDVLRHTEAACSAK